VSTLDCAAVLRPDAYRGFFDHEKTRFLNGIRKNLEDALAANLDPSRNNQLDDWRAAICALPEEPGLRAPAILEGRVSAGSPPADSDRGAAALRSNLRALMPWRKGPWDICGIHIDTEWRSDWKWDRVLPHLSSLGGRRVLDIGCGNGYHLWRIRAAGADAALGLEPHLLNVAQFALMQRWFPQQPVAVLPLALEEYPVNTRIYDTVFSMGVIYHRKSPADHLLHAKSCLREGGELVLETLVVPGDENTVLVPEDRYGKMRNVWYIPSAAHTRRLLSRTGFRDIRLVDLTPTSMEEQRATEWMEFESLSDFLHPENRELTIEGYPAPTRATFIAIAP
jgi:tRNA (mo5U34)-methyltransferase